METELHAHQLKGHTMELIVRKMKDEHRKRIRKEVTSSISHPHESPFQTGEEVGFSEIAAVSVGEVVGMWPSPFQTGDKVGFSEIAAVSVGEDVGMWPSPATQ